jgi:hypothetical protein
VWFELVITCKVIIRAIKCFLIDWLFVKKKGSEDLLFVLAMLNVVMTLIYWFK